MATMLSLLRRCFRMTKPRGCSLSCCWVLMPNPDKAFGSGACLSRHQPSPQPAWHLTPVETKETPKTSRNDHFFAPHIPILCSKPCLWLTAR